MIDPRELRIGNYISDIHAPDGCFFDVESIEDKTCIYGAGFRSKYENLTPIPLTEEWLLKLGAKDIFGTFYFEGYIEMIFDKDKGFRLGCEGCEYSRELKYVHQLQNIIHAISGKKLTITQYENTI